MTPMPLELEYFVVQMRKTKSDVIDSLLTVLLLKKQFEPLRELQPRSTNHYIFIFNFSKAYNERVLLRKTFHPIQNSTPKNTPRKSKIWQQFEPSFAVVMRFNFLSFYSAFDVEFSSTFIICFYAKNELIFIAMCAFHQRI